MITVLSIFWIIFVLYFGVYRGEKVYEYRCNWIDRDFKIYKNLPSYYKMIFSFKPLKDKYWVK